MAIEADAKTLAATAAGVHDTAGGPLTYWMQVIAKAPDYANFAIAGTSAEGTTMQKDAAATADLAVTQEGAPVGVYEDAYIRQLLVSMRNYYVKAWQALQPVHPATMVDADWLVDTGTLADDLDITVTLAPATGGSAITDYEYDIDGSGTGISLAISAPATVIVTMALPDTEYAIRTRAVNAIGKAAWSNTESATSGA